MALSLLNRSMSSLSEVEIAIFKHIRKNQQPIIMTSFLKRIVTFSLVIFSMNTLIGQKAWPDLVTVEDLYENHEALLLNLLDEINLDYPGLEKVKQSFEAGEIVEACDYLLNYYETNGYANHLRKEQPPRSNQTEAASDTILEDVFTIQEVKAKVPYGEDGHRDWYYKGPYNDREWAWLSNRHQQIGRVLSTYFKTGNPKYAIYIDLFLRDFILKSQPYPEKKTSGSIWRGLEVSFRAKIWPSVFYGLINSKYLSAATKLLILSSLPDHGDYNRKYHAAGNWLTMEMTGLTSVAINFPEYKKSEEWLSYAAATLTKSMTEQVYPDGVQKELTAHYHYVALRNFEEFKNKCDLVNKTVPDSFLETLQSMYDYTAKSTRPNGHIPLNNDGDLMYNREKILKGAELFKRADWEYIATNGQQGTEPVSTSFFYPWAGQLISRSGYDQEAHWSFFDVGPWGIGHQHNDKLHLSISALGYDFLVDSGRFAYSGEVAKKFRSYAKGSTAHNTVAIDGKGQGAGPKFVMEPLSEDNYKITAEYDFATSSFEDFMDLEGAAKHQRSLFYLRGKFWIVVDRVITDRPREIETFWHWHPECKVKQVKGGIQAKRGKAKLRLHPVGQKDFDLQQIRGREPNLQGWYSPSYNVFEENTVTAYKTAINTNKTMVWLIQVSEGRSGPIAAQVIAESDEKVDLELKYGKQLFQISIPYFDSGKLVYRKR